MLFFALKEYLVFSSGASGAGGSSGASGAGGLGIYNFIIDKIIRKGGDTDTNAAIAGAVIGAILGHSKLIENDQFRYNLSVLVSASPDYGQLQVSAPANILYHPARIEEYANRLSRFF